MSNQIQPNIFCENCIKCGSRPVSEQTKKGWEIKCPNTECKNLVAGKLLDFDTWNRINKSNVTLKKDTELMRSA
jgi:DNA-directed RNA polymerase subunit RPC12/RpoP